MTATEAAAALEDARLHQRLDRDREDWLTTNAAPPKPRSGNASLVY
ncbi:hypothetical protein AB0J81_38245 [Streptomyces bobili]